MNEITEQDMDRLTAADRRAALAAEEAGGFDAFTRRAVKTALVRRVAAALEEKE